MAVAVAVAGAGCGTTTDPDPVPSGSPPSGSCAAGAPVEGTPPLTAVRVAAGLSQPVDLQVAPGDRTRLFVAEQGGRIRIVRGGTVVPQPFLDLSASVSRGGEQGLLGLAFHPRYDSNGRFFVNYTDRVGDTHVAEFRVGSSPEVADANSERTVLFVEQPFDNHNGGGLAFGSDGLLYVALGDGGSGGDPFRNAQNVGRLLGKILRIDVDGGVPYAIPPGNPFTGTPGARGEVWALGLRNPWRFSFDRGTGDMYIGDVGQNRREEVSVGLASGRGGENYGWNITEGTACFSPSSGCNTSGLTLPVIDYATGSAGSCAVTGGYVYRGCRMPGYHGTYFYGDYCAGFVRSFRLQGGAAIDQRDLSSALSRDLGLLTSFGQDHDGELYLVDHDGDIFRISPSL
ncbi:MAG TPA: PQQ-dependent sugar dehydrogenase [Vicinamibacteria bacterium]|nr:PQQ-dependent sugar dehydrogenase [Vicinamibacteria bacterium]